MSSTSEMNIGEAIRSTCILATVRAKALGLTHTDKDASRDVEDNAKATRGAARVVVHRLPGADKHHKAIVKAQITARQALQRYSMPYGNDEGWRLLPNVNWDKFSSAYATAKAEVDRAYEGFLADMDNVISQANLNRGNLNVRIPTREELQGAYALDFEVREVPHTNFPGLPEGVSRAMQKHAQRRLEQAVSTAVQDTLHRFVSPLEHFVERMEAYDKRLRAAEAGEDVGKRMGVFSNSILDGINELTDVINNFNMTGDPRLDELRKRVAAFNNMDADDLRQDETLRAHVTKDAKNILDNLNDWLGVGR